MLDILFGPIGVLTVTVVVLLATALPLWRSLNVYWGASTRRQTDASALGLQPPRDIVPIITDLIRLGFHRLGEAQLDLPGIRAVPVSSGAGRWAAQEFSNRHTIFVMVDADGTVIAETGQVPGLSILVSFNSAFADGTAVETMFPKGESIHDADFHSGHNSRSLDAAYEDQRREIGQWRMHHGTPDRVSSMADYLRADSEFRKRYSRRKLRGPLLRRQILPAALVVIAALVLAFVALRS